MKKNKIIIPPCKYCITLAICKNLYTGEYEKNGVFMARKKLEERCKILEKYITKNTNIRYVRITLFHQSMDKT